MKKKIPRYKAWDKKTKTLSYVTAILISNNLIITADGSSSADDMILMEYTGFTDKDGEEATEFSILETDESLGGENGVIEKINGVFMLVLPELLLPLHTLFPTDFRIVGNAFQHSYLLDDEIWRDFENEGN